jgi:hypothetical protein
MFCRLISQHYQRQGNRRNDPNEEKSPTNGAALIAIKFVAKQERNSGTERATSRSD